MKAETKAPLDFEHNSVEDELEVQVADQDDQRDMMRMGKTQQLRV